MADTKFKPTLSKPVSKQSQGFEKNFKKTMNLYNVKLDEVDGMLSEVEQSLKKKIFSLAKMEALVFSDPKLSAVYEEMSVNGEEKYGYHYNETIMNMLFNDYVLNSPKYLQKYKQAIPKEKKRRDKSGINQLKKTGEKMQTRNLATQPKPVKPVAEGDEQPTKVLFLVNEKDPKDPDLFAYFPEENSDREGNFKTAYSHVGQHSSAHPDYAKESRPATPEEYAPLKTELESLGYNLDVLNGMTETSGSGGAGGGGAFSSGSGQYSAPLGFVKRKLAEDEEQPTEPDEEDCVISSDGNKYSVGCGGKFIGDFVEWDDAMNAVIKWQDLNKWYPNIWFISDHGNASLIDREGNIINEASTSGSVGGPGRGSGAYFGPAMWGSGDLMKTKGKAAVKTKPAWKGGQIIQESNYLTETNGFEKFIENLNEEDLSYQQKLGKEYKQSHTGSNKGLGVSEVPQTPERTQKKKGIDDNTALFIGQDVDKMRDKDVAILHTDMTNKNTMFPHKDNPILKNDGIAGNIKEFDKTKADSTIIDKTSAFTSNTVKDWNKPDTGTELNTLKTGDPDKPNLKPMEEAKDIEEMAKSRKQQRLFGMAHAVQKGELSPSKVGGAVKKIAKDVSPKDVEDFAKTKHKGLPEKVKSEGKKLNEFLSLHDVVEYISDRSGEEPFILHDIKWQFVNAKYPDGKTDIGVYRFGHDLVYDYNRWREEMGINENTNNIKEETQTMIQSNGTSMSNKAVATGDQSGNVDMGIRTTGGGSMSESIELLEEINNELKAFSIHHDKLKKMTEDRKPSALVLRDRVGSENEKNFKKDLKDSSVAKEVDIENSLEWKDQQTEVKDPYELGEKLEKGEVKAADMKSGEALKDVGDSANDKGDEIPKRNRTKEEQDEVDKYRLGLGDLVYDNEPGKRFEDRMKKDMGDKLYKERQEKLKFRGKAPMYNKDPQPVEDTTADKVQFDKEQTGWNERVGLKEGMVSGKYFNELGKKRIVDFDLKEVIEIKDAKEAENFQEVSLEGLGNTYTQKVSVNENVVKAMNEHKFYTDGKKVFALKNPVQNLNEAALITKPVVNEQMNKMKHLLGYKPETFTNTDNTKKNRGF